MSWSIVEVARISGVTARTLRHYDEIGLLAPAGVRSNGYRYYEQAELLRLQQILVLRELGLGLDRIAAILDRQVDQLQALREHYAKLIGERDRLGRVARTVAHTIAELEAQEGISGMTEISRPENLFEGFDPSRHDSDVLERWPEQQRAWEEAKRLAASTTPAETDRIQRETTAAMIRMAEHMAAGTAVDDDAVQAEIHNACQLARPAWSPDAESLRKLARTYVDDATYTATFDRIAPGLAKYYRDAMLTFADRHPGR